MVMDFNLLLPKRVVFGLGKFRKLPELLSFYGRKILLITGKSSFLSSDKFLEMSARMKENRMHMDIVQIKGEPTPQIIDEAVSKWADSNFDAIVAVGGGSVLDAGKAISAMIPLRKDVKKYLEGVGDGSVHPGTKLPYIAVPTTAGTGSEATKNAVISEVGQRGYKKSLRHDHFIPDIALVDPEMMVGCPENITAWSGMDAFTQLLESYFSTTANPFTDGIAVSGLQMISKYLERTVRDGSDIEARTGMAYAAHCSGITLANAGLGVVHGFASSIGGRYNIPHGLICAALMGVSNEITLNKLMKENTFATSFGKYARAGKLFFGSEDRDEVFYAEFLINKIHDLSLEFKIPGLGIYGFEKEEIPWIAENTSNKNNPVKLSPEELREILTKTI